MCAVAVLSSVTYCTSLQYFSESLELFQQHSGFAKKKKKCK